ncbi:M20/M25/M40 family metallo-hydrolase [Nonomuraea thailandensis]
MARGTGGGRSIMLNGHLDTVAHGTYDGDPLVPRVEDGRIHGRGAFDMKSGVAAMMAAAARATAGGRCAATSSWPAWPTRRTPASAPRRCWSASPPTAPS